MIIRRELEKRESQGDPIKVGIVGAGAMGAGTLHTMHNMAGMRCCAIADLDVQTAIGALEGNGITDDMIVVTDNRGKAQLAIENGKTVVTQDALMMTRLDIDVVLEATGSQEAGARVAYESILEGKHIVMLTVETEVLVGPLLARQAKSAGVVYTMAAGDQPGAIMELYHWANSLGFEVIAAGRGNIRYPEDRYQPPDSDSKGRVLISTNPKMTNSFKDGTKSQIEMAAVANATGLLPDIRGMHEPQAGFLELAKAFALKEDGGILSRRGVVEIANAVDEKGNLIDENRVHPGVFIVVDSSHPGVKKFMNQFFRWQQGPTGALFRPYHLTCLETPISIARAALFGQETGAPQKLYTEVLSVAKKDLKAGEMLDGIGGATVYGLVELTDVAQKEDLLPIGFADDIELIKPVRRDQAIKYSDVKVNTDSFLYRLRYLQDLIKY